MTVDLAVVGGGVAGATLAAAVAQRGGKVLVLERDTKFKDRVRGENILPWGVATARRLGVLDDLVAAGGRVVPFFNMYAAGALMDHRPLPETTPTREACINMYHPDLQETLLARAIKAGSEVKRGVTVQGISEKDGQWTASFVEDGQSRSVTARLLVGADGRFSQMREWGGFTVTRDPERLRIAGTMVQGTAVPDDGVHLCIGPGIGTFVAPLGNQRARMYFVYVSALGDRKLSGKDKVPAFLEACRATSAPGRWFDGVDVIGPLAEFEGADQSVPSPSKRGLALIGDAAAATDPSWGCGLSKTMVDVDTLATCLAESDDWDEAVRRYATTHDDYYGKLHEIHGWMNELVWTGGPASDERRARVFPRMIADPAGFPDSTGQGPFGPCDDRARRLILGED
jgi:2-polyprenyl-6-methoxyphenol hydroxylase-like FAD-dependent oxidoreductase